MSGLCCVLWKGWKGVCFAGEERPRPVHSDSTPLSRAFFGSLLLGRGHLTPGVAQEEDNC